MDFDMVKATLKFDFKFQNWDSNLDFSNLLTPASDGQPVGLVDVISSQPQ